MWRRRIWSGVLSLALLGGAAGVLCADDQPTADDSGPGKTFKLKTLPLAEAISQQSELAYSGQRIYLGFTKTEYYADSTQPKAEVKKYPKLHSAKPLYGAVPLCFDPKQPKVHTDYLFVIDASSGPKYDRLYFDVNRNLDLTDDPPLKLSESEAPKGLWDRSDPTEARSVFQELEVPMDFGPDVGLRPVPILPMLFVRSTESATLMFVAMTCYGGTIELGKQSYDAILAQPHWISGRFDSPDTGIYLTAQPKRAQERWWGAERLGSYRLVGDTYYTLTATPIGDELTVKPYRGDLGSFQVAAGGRKLDELQMQGSLTSPAHAVAIGKLATDQDEYNSLAAVKELQVPAGDYTADYLSVNFGPLRLAVSMNYHTDGSPRNMQRERKYAIQIRKDRPFILDFSAKPEVVFASPAKNQVLHPGDELSVKAVLVDPTLDVMIRRLDDTRQKVKKELNLGDGRTQSYETTKSLDPTVTIKNAAGQTVSEGLMPFG